MKQTQNQFYGKKAEMPHKMPPGSTYICSDEDLIYHAREDGLPIVFKPSEENNESLLLKSSSGYSSTGAFSGKSNSNNFVWEAGNGINYSQSDVDKGLFKVFSLDKAVHFAGDNPYWSTPTPNGTPGIGLFQGEHLPKGVTSLIDYDFNYNVNIIGNSNFIKNSEDLNDWRNDSPDFEATLDESQVGPEGGNVWLISKTSSTSSFVSFKNSQVDVSPETSYSFKFKVQKKNDSPNTDIQARVRDQTNENIFVQHYYTPKYGDGWVEIQISVVTPAGCSRVQLAIIADSDPIDDILITEVQLSTTSFSDYIPTTGTPVNNAVVHGHYALEGGTKTGHENSKGRIRLNDLQYGDQLRVRFDYNVIPQIENTTVEPALWYSNRDENDSITYSFSLTSSPVFYGIGTAGKSYLNRSEISAWIVSDQDLNALTLPAIKSDNQVIIQPLSMLITIIR